MNLMKESIVLKVVTLLCLILLGLQGSNAQDRTQRDQLAGLKRALSEAGATALSTDQETALKTLITDYQASRAASTPDATLVAAQTAYETAILAGDLATASAQASIIATRKAALELAELQAEAKFKTSFLNTLTAAQLNALKTRFGTSGLLRLLGGDSGFGGGGGRGRN